MHGDRLKVVREWRGLSQEELASRIKVGTQQIWRWENNKTTPNADYVARLARELDTTADYLLGLTNDPKGQIEMSDLSPLERQLVMAFRRGEITEALSLAAELAKSK